MHFGSIHTHSHAHTNTHISLHSVVKCYHRQPLNQKPVSSAFSLIPPYSSHSLFILKITNALEFCYRDCSFGVGWIDKAMRKRAEEAEELCLVWLCELGRSEQVASIFMRFMCFGHILKIDVVCNKDSLLSLLRLSHFPSLPSLYSSF